MPATNGVGELEESILRQSGGGLGAGGLDAVEPDRPVAERSVPAQANLLEDGGDTAHVRDHPLDGDEQDRGAACGFEPR